jgi:hypothetical protein
MSVAIVNTQNNLGLRTLRAYDPRNVRRGPAEPGPSAAANPVTLHGVPMYDIVHSVQFPFGPPIAPSDGSVSPIVHPVVFAAAPPTANPNGTASQSPTGSIIDATKPINAQINPSVATQIAPAPNPTAVATMGPATQPGYVVVTSGGGTIANTPGASPDYFAEVEAWLTQNTLISAVPNWVPLVGVAVLLGFVWGGGKKR